MVGVNKVILLGNLGKNPDVVAFPQERNNETSNLVKKASFPLATTEYRRNKDGERIEQTEWHNVVCWRSDKDGNKRYITEVVADNFIVIANRNRQDETASHEPDPLSSILNNDTEPIGDLPF